jgi:hypothetical protein
MATRVGRRIKMKAIAAAFSFHCTASAAWNAGADVARRKLPPAGILSQLRSFQLGGVEKGATLPGGSSPKRGSVMCSSRTK